MKAWLGGILLLWPAASAIGAPKRAKEHERSFIRYHIGMGNSYRDEFWRLEARAAWQRREGKSDWKKTLEEAHQAQERYAQRYAEAIRLARKGYGLDRAGPPWKTRFSELGRLGDRPASTDRGGTVVFWHAFADEDPDVLALVLTHERLLFQMLSQGRSLSRSDETRALRKTLALAREWNVFGALDALIASLERESGPGGAVGPGKCPEEAGAGMGLAHSEAAVLGQWLKGATRR